MYRHYVIFTPFDTIGICCIYVRKERCFSSVLIITKISRQKKNTSRYNIFIANEYAFSVSEDVLVRYRLYKGMELTRELMKEIKASESWNKVYSDALFYLNYRMRTEKEMSTN